MFVVCVWQQEQMSHLLPSTLRDHQPLTYNLCRQVAPKEKLGRTREIEMRVEARKFCTALHLGQP